MEYRPFDGIRAIYDSNNRSEPLTRRKALQGIAEVVGMCLLGVSSAYLIGRGEQTEANKQLINFPTSFPAEVEVTKHPEPNAKYCMVHLKQIHYFHPAEMFERFKDDPKGRDIVLSMYGYTNYCQQELAKAFTHLVDQGITNTLYIESALGKIDPRAAKQRYEEFRADLARHGIADNRGLLSQLSNAIATKQPIDGKSLDECVSLHEEIKQKEDTARFIPGFYTLPEFRERFEIHGAGRSWNEEVPIPSPIRERNVLEICTETDEPLKVVLFGSGHDFKYRIKEWNTHNLNKKFSLIEVSVPAVERIFSQLRD